MAMRAPRLMAIVLPGIPLEGRPAVPSGQSDSAAGSRRALKVGLQRYLSRIERASR